MNSYVRTVVLQRKILKHTIRDMCVRDVEESGLMNPNVKKIPEAIIRG